MKTILDIGKQGAEYIDMASPTPEVGVDGMQQYLTTINKFPTEKISAEVNDGTKRDIEIHTLLLNNPLVFDLIWRSAVYEPIVYARQGDRMVMGILSPNFDAEGKNRLSSLKMLPLKQAYPLFSKGTLLAPDAPMATMLAGSAHAEGKDSGSHLKPVSEDYEHKLTIIGAISVGKNTITENGAHIQHALRSTSSVAAGLSDGRLGDVFMPDGDATGGFRGYDIPMIFVKGQVQSGDAIFFPKGFLDTPAAYGVHYSDAARIAYGASLQIVHNRYGRNNVSERMKQITVN